MSATEKTSVEILRPTPMPAPKIDDYSYTLGFSKGYEAADSSTVCWALGLCAVLVIICCFIVLYNHLSQQNDILSRFCTSEKNRKGVSNNGRFFSLLLPLAFTVCLAGCAGKQSEVVTPAPVSPEITNAPKPADGVTKEGAFTPYDASYREDGSGQYLAVHIPADPASGPRHGDPAELAGLLEMTGTATGKEKTAVQLMRPKAIREAARLITFQTAMSWRYGQLVAETERYSAVMDTAFNFAPLMLTQGEALIMPPLLTRAGASMRH